MQPTIFPFFLKGFFKSSLEATIDSSYSFITVDVIVEDSGSNGDDKDSFVKSLTSVNFSLIVYDTLSLALLATCLVVYDTFLVFL
jgi:hypothetical protein